MPWSCGVTLKMEWSASDNFKTSYRQESALDVVLSQGLHDLSNFGKLYVCVGNSFGSCQTCCAFTCCKRFWEVVSTGLLFSLNGWLLRCCAVKLCVSCVRIVVLPCVSIAIWTSSKRCTSHRCCCLGRGKVATIVLSFTFEGILLCTGGSIPPA